MIYTLTLNPAVDRELQVESIRFDSVLRATSWRVDVGGKGFNVSRMLQALGEPSTALAFAGGHSGAMLQEGLEALGVATDFVWLEDAETRTNVSIIDRTNQRYIKVNEPGPTVPEDARQALLAKVAALAQAGDWWVLSGSLPPGVPAHFYASLIELLRQAGAYTVLDTSGPALHIGCQAGPFLVKPNLEEAAELTGLPATSPADWVTIARRILELGVSYVVISLGEQGALLATAEDVWFARPPHIRERNPIGAGDSMVAGMVWALSQALPANEVLRRGIACGAATASRDGTAVGDLAMVQALLPQVLFSTIPHETLI